MPRSPDSRPFRRHFRKRNPAISCSSLQFRNRAFSQSRNVFPFSQSRNVFPFSQSRNFAIAHFRNHAMSSHFRNRAFSQSRNVFPFSQSRIFAIAQSPRLIPSPLALPRGMAAA
jgi:hypothetical protein